MEKEIKVHNTILHEGDIVNTVDGRAKLTYIGRQSFTNWYLIDDNSKFPFGRPVTVEDNDLNILKLVLILR